MKGYIFEYYKYVRYPKGTLKDIEQCLNYVAAERSILTFGEYDRLKINNIFQFDRFRDLSVLAKDWVGNRQSILLYDFGDEPEFIYVDDENEWGFKAVKTGEFDRHLFWALTELPFRSILREKMDKDNYEELLLDAQKKLQNIIQEESTSGAIECKYMILGTLGSFGISVLWFSDQYVDILRVVNNIKCDSKYKGERMYLAAHTMISRNPFYDNVKEDDMLVSKIQGKAFVQVTLKKWINQSLEFINDDHVQNLRHTSGEYDIAMEMDSKDAFTYFEKKKIFNHDENEYQNNILQTKVTLAEAINECSMKEGPSIEIEEDNLADNLNKVEDAYKKLRKLIGEKIDKTAGIIDTLDSLHCDYRYNVTSAVNQSWADDFSYIFLKNIECITEIINIDSTYDVDVMSILRGVLNNLKQQIFHISEANSLNFELPKCHLRYTGQEDCILFSYMGIIKEILQTAYRLKGVNKQTEIIPIVTVDVLPIIESEMYFDKSHYVSENDADQDFKIVSLNLPHVTFYDVPIFILYLYHEIYHYIVPGDRERRDYVMGILLSAIYSRNILYESLLRIFGYKVELVGKIVSYVKPLIYDIVINQYPEVHRTITCFNGCKRKKDTDTVLLIAEVYKDKLIDYLSGQNSCIKDWFVELYNRLCEGTFHGLSFADMYSRKDDFSREAVTILKEWLEKVKEGECEFEFEEKEPVIDKIMDGMEEVSADIPMIELSNMPLSEYMILYSRCLKNELQDPKVIDLSKELKELVRIGVILDFYEHNGSCVEEVKDEFIYLYISKYINLSDDKVFEIKSKIHKRREEAEDWYNYFLMCWREYKDQFGLYRSQCRMLAEMTGIKRRLSTNDIDTKCGIYFQKYREIYKDFSQKIKEIEDLCGNSEEDTIIELCHQLRRELNEKMFAENIKLINHFQAQEKLTQLHSLNEQNNKKKENNNQPYRFPIFKGVFESEGKIQRKEINISKIPTVYKLEGFLERIDSVTKQLEQSCRNIFGIKECPLWYRGQENSIYGLLPGVMRKNNTNRLDFNYLSQYQRYLYEEFKYRADGAPEVMDRSYYGISDYLALMQHYGVNTNLMDWSEDAFTGLYFALEKLIIHEKRMLESDAAIFVFSPHLYNEARNYMINEGAQATSCTESAFLASKKTADCSDGLIPNIAAVYNGEVYDMFLMGNREYESENRYGYINEMLLKGKEEMAYLPLAVYTSRLNPRIRSQSGIFVAYNLYTEPSISVDSYSYMDLEKVQDYYLNVCKRKNKERFLYKIVIEKNAAKEIAECLVRMGFSKERIYPELTSIGQRIK